MKTAAETYALNQKAATRIRITQRRMEKFMVVGLTIRDRVGNKAMRRRTGITDIIEKISRLN